MRKLFEEENYHCFHENITILDMMKSTKHKHLLNNLYGSSLKT